MAHNQLLVLVLVVLVGLAQADLWPLPKDIQYGFGSTCISSKLTVNSQCENLQDAVDRYQNNLFFPVEATNGVSYSVSIIVDDCKKFFTYGTDESYTISLSNTAGKITAPNTFGAMRALETLSQVFEYNEEGCYNINNISLTISDEPRFPWRGMLIDTARHYLSVDTLKKQIDAMSYAKFNTFHWHMIDAQSFPIDVEAEPELSRKGAYKYPEASYSVEDVIDIVNYANSRGMRVISEIEMPGHAASWGKAYPEIVAHCPRYQSNINNIPLNPSIRTTYDIIATVLAQIAAIVPDEYIHVGGDEVVTGCWFNDPNISTWANENGFDGNDIFKYFEDNVATIFTDLKRKRVVWEEVFLAGALTMDVPSIVQVWKDRDTMQKVISAGYEAIESYGFYLDKQIPSISHPKMTHYLWLDTWSDFYSVEPTNGITGDISLIKGGEACMWGEQINDQTLFTRIWPRAGAVAERLWSAQDVTNNSNALPRLEEFSCRLKRRGIDSSPIRPGYCDDTTFLVYN